MDFFQFEISSVATYSTVTLTFLFGYYVNYLYQRWEAEFSVARVSRNNKHSPSNKQRPDITK